MVSLAPRPSLGLSGERGARGVVSVSSNTPVVRVPGYSLVYAESTSNVPSAFVQLLQNWPVLHDCLVFVTVRQVAIPSVDPKERLLLLKLEYPGFYQVRARQRAPPGCSKPTHLPAAVR